MTIKQHTQNPDSGKNSSRSIEFRALRIPFALIVALVLMSGIVHGIMDGRWVSKDSIERGNRLSQVPEKLGNWTLVESKELDDIAAGILRCYGSEVRVYRHEPTSSLVTVAILFGPRGPIAVHTPEVCYSSVGTSQTRKRTVEAVWDSDTKHEFWSVQFAQKPATDATLEVWYGWSDGHEWVASENPRFWITKNLYKIQLATTVGNDDFNPSKDFLTKLIPELKSLIQ